MLRNSSCFYLPEFTKVMDDYGDFFYEEDKMGMRLTSGSAEIAKDGSNLVGISIGGGAPLCPCLYIVQVFDNTPTAKEGSLEAGDEITGVNKVSVKGKTKTEVARMIQASKVTFFCCTLFNFIYFYFYYTLFFF